MKAYENYDTNAGTSDINMLIKANTKRKNQAKVFTNIMRSLNQKVIDSKILHFNTPKPSLQ